MATPAVIQAKLVPESDAPTQVEQPAAIAFVSMVERLAVDPRVDVDKLERLLKMQQDILAHQAKADFDAAFSEMQGDLPVITERGQILVNDVPRSKYARYEDIQEAIRPVLQKHGFALRHRNENLASGILRIVGILSHRSGHSEQDSFDCPADASGGKSNIQAIGSTRSYGMRYTTIALLNIVTRGADDDGQAAGRANKPQAEPPAGYEDWLEDMGACADEGWPRLSQAFAKSKPEYRKHVTTVDKTRWTALRAKAEQKGGGK